jgi:hypothetical protein
LPRSEPRRRNNMTRVGSLREGIARMNTLSGTLADLGRQGFTRHFQVVGHRARTLDNGRALGPDQVLIPSACTWILPSVPSLRRSDSIGQRTDSSTRWKVAPWSGFGVAQKRPQRPSFMAAS